MKPVTPYGIAKLAADQSGACIGRNIRNSFPSDSQPRIASPNYLSRRVCLGVAAIKRGEAKELQLGDLSAGRDWVMRAISSCNVAVLAGAKPTTFFASGQQQGGDLVAAFRAELDWREFVKDHARTTICNKSPTDSAVIRARRRANLVGNGRNFETMVLSWSSRVGQRSEMDRANPLAKSDRIYPSYSRLRRGR
jgi:hypothetical protein